MNVNISSETSKQNELNSLVSVLRAIVLSRKQPCSISAVMKDYFELENRQIPYRRFGFSSPLDFFQQSGEFIINISMGEEAYIATRINSKSAHIVELVRLQKSNGRASHLTKIQPLNSSTHQKRIVQHGVPFRGNIQNLNNSNLIKKQKQEIQQQLQRKFTQQLQDELDKQKRHLNLKFENEKEIFKNELLNELRLIDEKFNFKIDPNNNSGGDLKSVQESVALQKELKNFHERLSAIENCAFSTEFVTTEIEKSRFMTSELKQLKDQLTQLSNRDKKMLKSLEKQNNNNPNQLRTKREENNKVSTFNIQTQDNLGGQVSTRQQSIVNSKDTTVKTQPSQQQLKIAKTSTTELKSQKQKVFTQPQITTLFDNYKQNNKAINSNLAPIDLRHRLNAMCSQNRDEKLVVPTANVAKYLTENETLALRPILGQHNSIANQLENSSTCNFNNNKNSNTLTPPLSMPFIPDSHERAVNRLTKHQSVQSRLKPKIDIDKKFSNGNVSVKSENSAQGSKKLLKFEKNEQTRYAAPTFTNRNVWKFDPKFDPCESISMYCTARGGGDPKFNVFKSKQGLYDCQLVINANTIYSTYPKEYQTADKARHACAEKAIQQIQIVEARNLLPTFPSEKEFLDVLYNELLLHPNGIISDKMPEWFVDKFEYVIPENWFSLIKNCNRFILEEGIKESTFIILANKEVAEINTENESDLEIWTIKREQLQLPWKKNGWDLCITHCVSTIEIWATLIGSQYNACLDSLTLEINSYMSKQKTRPDVIAPKHIYLVEECSCWQRVLVESLDKEKQQAFCFYIDFGFTKYLPVNELYLCDTKFLCLAPQAVLFSLFGLEDYTGNPNAVKCLENYLLNHAVIAKIVTKQSDFEANGIIQVIMYDTSTEDDINLNLMLQEGINQQSRPPQLKIQSTTSVKVTNIDCFTGDVSFQIINADSEYVERTFKRIIDSKFKEDQHKCSAEELLKDQILLVHDDDSSINWCRAKLLDLNQAHSLLKGEDQKVDIIYIDHNIKRRVHASKIYRLESLSTALSKFPAQAVCVKLYDIPEFSKHIINRICALLPKNSQAFVRVEAPADVPLVTILRQVNGPDMPYCNINDDLRLEIERVKDSTLCPKSLTIESASSSTSGALQSPTQLFQGLTLASAPMLPLKISGLLKLREYDVNLPLNATFFVNVILVSNPLSFTVQPYNDDFKRLLNLMKQLQDYCSNNEAYIPTDMVEVGQAYSAKKGDNYYRVIAKSRCCEMVNVLFCDYGDSGTVRSDHLKVLPVQFRQLPIMGIDARLYGIEGKSGDVWKTDDVKRFRNLVLGKKMASFIKGTRRSKKGTLELSLDLVDVKGDDDVNIRSTLLNEKRVLPIASLDH